MPVREVLHGKSILLDLVSAQPEILPLERGTTFTPTEIRVRLSWATWRKLSPIIRRLGHMEIDTTEYEEHITSTCGEPGPYLMLSLYGRHRADMIYHGDYVVLKR